MTTQIVFCQSESQVAQFQHYFSGNQSIPLEKLLHEKNSNLQQAREIGDGAEEARLLRELGLIHMNRVPDYAKAMDLFIRALAIEDSLNLTDEKALTYVAVARVFELVGDFAKSAKLLEQARSMNQETRSINSLAMILNHLGKVNAARGDVDAAFDNFQQILRYKDDIDKGFEAQALFNLGHLYTTQGQYDKALSRHKQALAVARALRDSKLEAQCLNDIGVLYALMKNDEKSLANHEVALKIRLSTSDKRGVAESRNNIASVYLKRNDLQTAISQGLLALEIGRESQAHDQIHKSCDLLSQAYKELGDYKNALNYKELTVAIYELIQGEKLERELLETENRYVVEKKETEIQKLDALRIEREREIQNQKKFRNILFLVVALVVVTAGLLLILYLVKRRSNKILQVAKKEVQLQNTRLQELNATKDKFFSIISHDLKGPLNSLTSFSHLLIDHTDSISKEEIQLLAKDLDKSVKNLLTLLENLLEWARSQTGNIDFTGETFDLAELLDSNKNLLQSQAAAKQIGLTVQGAGPCTVKLHKQSINTVIRNLISNAIKFTPEGGSIRVGLKRERGQVHVFVADNGVGMSSDVLDKLFRIDSKHSTRGTANEKGTGLGLILCRDFVEKNGGVINVQSTPGKGSVFSFSFPETVCSTAPQVGEPVSF
jgi:signal transduction histidine kinase